MGFPLMAERLTRDSSRTLILLKDLLPISTPGSWNAVRCGSGVEVGLVPSRQTLVTLKDVPQDVPLVDRHLVVG